MKSLCNTQWEYGDGNTSSIEGSHSYTYQESGQYTISVTVEGEGGSNTTSVSVEVDISEYDKLAEYLINNNLDLNYILISELGKKWLFYANAAEDVAGMYILDIRSEETFDSGHIEGAINISVSEVLQVASNANGKQILVVDYSGQTASYIVALLRLYGYSEAQALKWGMSGWNSSTDIWSGKVGDTGDGKLTTDAAPDNENYDKPVINTGFSEGNSILKARVERVIKEWGSATISSSDIIANPANYFVNNYFPSDHYAGFGHVLGAVRVNPMSLTDESTRYLNPNETIVNYGYNGITCSAITAFLRVLGYDAKVMLFGMNGLNHSNPFWTTGEVANHWGVNANPKDFPLVN